MSTTFLSICFIVGVCVTLWLNFRQKIAACFVVTAICSLISVAIYYQHQLYARATVAAVIEVVIAGNFFYFVKHLKRHQSLRWMRTKELVFYLLVVPAFFTLLYVYVYASFLEGLTTAQQMECVSAACSTAAVCLLRKRVVEVWVARGLANATTAGLFGHAAFAHGHTASYLVGAFYGLLTLFSWVVFSVWRRKILTNYP